MRMLIGLLFCCTIYFLPFGIGMLRNKRNKAAIFFLNLLLGWTFIGWVIAFVWAISHRGSD